MGSSGRFQAKLELLSAAVSCVCSDLSMQTRMPGPNDDAESQLNDENLLDVARRYVKAHEGVSTIMGGTTGVK